MTQKKYPQNLHTQKNIYFSENPKNIETQNFDPKKMVRAYVCMKISEYPPSPPPPGSGHIPELRIRSLSSCENAQSVRR